MPGGRARTERFTGFIGEPQVRVIQDEGFTIYEEDRIVLSPGCPSEADCQPARVPVPAGGGYSMEWWVGPELTAVLHYRVLEAR